MQYLLTAYDGEDEQALERRLRAREQHLAMGEEMAAAGTLLFAAAILGDQGRMIGATLVLDFPSRAELDAWLKTEPYVVGDVWQRIEIQPCKVGPAFTAQRP